MRITLSNRIAEAAQEIAKRKDVNITFFANVEGVIEGCRFRKSSEVYEYDVEKECFIYNTTKTNAVHDIISEAIEIVKAEELALMKPAEESIISENEKAEKYEILNDAKMNGTIEELASFNFIDCEFPENGTDYHNAIVMEDTEYWFIDLGLGLGFGQYPKEDFSLEEAIESAIND